MFVIITYDVPAKRTGIYRKLLREFLTHEQASVFMGDLPESEILRMVAKISEKIGPDDRVLKLVCRNRHNVEVCRLSKEALGGQMREERDNWHGNNWALV
ncbi:MAG: CRISPR-associated endonuclease Cas2 [Acidobacteriota bacterium]|nr:CRISPR-associated endonuclease Cas2 [Acidobacteriota bacterium]